MLDPLLACMESTFMVQHVLMNELQVDMHTIPTQEASHATPKHHANEIQCSHFSMLISKACVDFCANGKRIAAPFLPSMGREVSARETSTNWDPVPRVDSRSGLALNARMY